VGNVSNDSGKSQRPAYPGGPMASPARIPRVLSIAGSDSGGGAGIQADLKAFARCGVHGMTALTAITAQNTVAVTAVYPLPPEAIVEQVRAVAEDIGVDAVKIGMLGNAETIETVAGALDLVGGAPVVLDPVMIAESGARLLDEEALDALRNRLVPRTAVVTPNLPEAAVLAGREAAPETLARAIHELGAGAVVVTGGHREEATDVFFDGEQLVELSGDRHPDGAAHGSGCTHSSALAANLALGYDPLESARSARQIAAEAVRDGLREVGAGAGPVDALGLARRRSGSTSVP
jgi:hydroxymethylpyrimidine/phosphomethylpyrimidine kinase